MHKDDYQFAFIAEEVLRQTGMSKKDIIRALSPEVLSDRTLYAYFSRKTGSIEIAAAIAMAMGKSLNDIYVPVKTGGWAKQSTPSAPPTPPDTEDGGVAEKIAKALSGIIDTNDYHAMKKIGSEIGLSGHFQLAGMFDDYAQYMKTKKDSEEGGGQNG